MPLWVYKLGILAVLLAGGYWYYTSTQAKILELELFNQAYESAQVQQLATIARLKNASVKNQAAYIELDKKLDSAKDYSNSLEKKLQKHNLTRLAIAKPGLIEGIINDATKKKLEDLESITAKQPAPRLRSEDPDS